jgi:hypothetical protein
MRDYWSLDALCEFPELFWEIVTKEVGKERLLEIHARIRDSSQLAIAQARQQGIRLPKWLVPPQITNLYHAYAVATIFASGVRYGRQVTPAVTQFLCNSEHGGQFLSLAEWVTPNLRADFDIALEEWDTPEVLSITQEAIELAYAFYTTMIGKAQVDSDGRPPIMGEFYMKQTGVDLVDELGLLELRLSVNASGIWISTIFPSQEFCPSWWSPKWDNLTASFGQRYGWVFRTLMGCLWYDLRVPRYRAFTMREKRRAYGVGGNPKVDDPALVLPRTLRELTWDDGLAHAFPKQGKRDGYSVRAHYRRLQEGQRASDKAVENAEMYGFPEPPDRYTFIQPYTVGEIHEKRPHRRIVAKGLQAAKVALSAI